MKNSPPHFEFKGLQWMGESVGGLRSAIALPQMSLSFDTGYGAPYLASIQNFFITHGHIDHAHGISYLIATKNLGNQTPPHFWMPATLIKPLEQIVQTWEKIENAQYKYQFHPAIPFEPIALNAHYFIKPFPTIHRIDSLGYTLFRTKKRLRRELMGQPQDKLIAMKKEGVMIDEVIEEPLATYLGDTQIEVFQSVPWIKESQLLFIEATYLDERKTIPEAKEWGHIHLDEILSLLPSMLCEKIVLTHVSSRYPKKEIEKILEKKIPPSWKDKISFLTS